MKKKISVLALVFIIMISISSSSAFAAKGYTYTKYPIVLVGGIFDYDNLSFVDYFYGVEFALEFDAWKGWWFSPRQQTTYIMLSPLQGTEARGLDLANQIQELLVTLDVEKVNIIAHSHGSTTSRVAMNILAEEAHELGKPNPIASLTTIAGPHYGTATADASTMPFFPQWLLDTVYSVLNFGGDVIAMATQVCYATFFPPEAATGHPQDYIGEQDMEQVAYDFTQEGIEQFNNKYQCAGIPQGGTYGWINNEMPKYGSDGAPGALAGNGLGQARPVSDPNATLYYSWTGDVSQPITNNDLLDISMVATWALSELYCNFGHITNKEDITTGDWSNFINFILTEIPPALVRGCEVQNTIATDAFIPVSSAKLGNFVADPYPWNHIDEQNQTMGCIGPGVISPIQVFRNHANRLYYANR